MRGEESVAHGDTAPARRTCDAERLVAGLALVGAHDLPFHADDSFQRVNGASAHRAVRTLLAPAHRRDAPVAVTALHGTTHASHDVDVRDLRHDPLFAHEKLIYSNLCTSSISSCEPSARVTPIFMSAT